VSANLCGTGGSPVKKSEPLAGPDMGKMPMLRNDLTSTGDFNMHFFQKHSKFDQAGGRMLGLASIGVGLSELLMPRKLEQWLGISDGRNTGILRALGVRELAHGVDILSHEDPGPGVRARVAGDMLDGALFAMAGKKTKRPGAFATAAVVLAGITFLDILFAKRLSDDD